MTSSAQGAHRGRLRRKRRLATAAVGAAARPTIAMEGRTERCDFRENGEPRCLCACCARGLRALLPVTSCSVVSNVSTVLGYELHLLGPADTWESWLAPVYPHWHLRHVAMSPIPPPPLTHTHMPHTVAMV
jgi:hypothetical protein